MTKANKAKILIVDDQPNWRDALVSLLSAENYTIKTVSSFDEAVAELDKRLFDIVLLDIRLVDKDIFNVQGLELLKRIKGRYPTTKVAIITGYPESIQTGVLNRYGANDLILKVPPGSRFDSKEFKERIQKLLQVND